MVKKMKKNKKQHKIKTQSLLIIILLLTITISNIIPATTAQVTSGTIQQNTIDLSYKNITVYAPAVGESQNGYIGVISTITVTIQDQGSGRVFVDTLPLAQIDMQGSARLAVQVATTYIQNDNNCTINPNEYDYFFVIRTSSPIIGGPSAGAIMTTAVIALLENWEMDDKTVMTGMINPDGSIGPIGGIPKKIDAAYSVGATRFLIPEGQDTYIEEVVEMVNTAWGPQQVIHQETKNVSDYAMDNYGIEVIEVADIDDVLLYYTGYQIPITTTPNSITTEHYYDSMIPLATTLLTQANNSLNNASTAYYHTNIPNNFPNYYRDSLSETLETAEQGFQESEQWFNQESYYTSTSKSFQSLINSRFITYACQYFNATDKESYIQQLLQQAKTYHYTQSTLAKNADVTGAISLQCIGAAQKRASEAALYLDSASDLIQRGEYYSALYQIAFSYQRSESINWWMGLTNHFNETNGLTNEDISNLANDYIQDAQQSIIYTGVILQELGVTSPLLTDAQNMLDTAKEDKNNDYPAAALFEALEALAKANLALELVDATTIEKLQSKIERANQSANAGISESRMLGIEPVLAVSYYEFAESLVTNNVQTALFYYKYSDLLTGILTVSSGCEREQGSRYVGIPEQTSSLWGNTFFNYMDYFIIYAIIGFLGGIAIGVLIGLIALQKNESKKQKKQQPTWTSQTIAHYQPPIIQHEEVTPFEPFPKNIHDYYKKTK